MLEIVLAIIKIAGIILASILGILIVAVCVVLFVPVRYRGEFSVSDGKEGEKKIWAELKGTFFLRLLRVYVTGGEAVRVQVKVLFFTLMDTAKEKKEKRTKGKKKDKAPEAEEKEPADGERQEAEHVPAEEKSTARKEQAAGAKKETDRVGAEEKKDKEAAPEKERTGIKEKIAKILQTIRDFCDKIRRMKEKAGEVGALWVSDHMVNSRSLLWRQFTYLLGHTKPKKLTGYIRFGFEDPSTTGYAMAVYGILYPIWSPGLRVEPDFERQVLDCHILLKGRIRAWHFVRAALRMFLSKDVRRVIRDVKNL